MKSNKGKIDALVLSLEEIKENCLDNMDNDEFHDQLFNDANIALEGYLELHNTIEKLEDSGLEVTEDIASSLYRIASPKINKDPVMQVTFESFGDKAKDFGKWVVEKIKAIYAWLNEKMKKLSYLVNLLYKRMKLNVTKDFINKSGDYSITKLQFISIINADPSDNSMRKYYESDNFSNLLDKIADCISYSKNIVDGKVNSTSNLRQPFEYLIKSVKPTSYKNTFFGTFFYFDGFPLFITNEGIEVLKKCCSDDIDDLPKHTYEIGNELFAILNYSSMQDTQNGMNDDFDEPEDSPRRTFKIDGYVLSEAMKYTLAVAEKMDKSCYEYQEIISDILEKISNDEDKVYNSSGALSDIIIHVKKILSILSYLLSHFYKTLNQMVSSCDQIANKFKSI